MHNSTMQKKGEVESFLGCSGFSFSRETWKKHNNIDEEGKDIEH